MLKLFLSSLALSTIICGHHVQAVNCPEFCYEEGKMCMKVCMDIFGHKKKCAELSEHQNDHCTIACFEQACVQNCDKTAQTAGDARKCKENCGNNDKNWITKPL